MWPIVEPRRDAVEVSCPDPPVSVPEGGGAGDPMELVGLATRDAERDEGSEAAFITPIDVTAATKLPTFLAGAFDFKACDGAAESVFCGRAGVC